MPESILSVKGLNASYKTKEILKGVSLEIKSGELTCLCGKNGSGKSTLFSILSKLTGGSLQISAQQLPEIQYENGEFFSVYKENQKSIAKKIAVMQQSEYSVWDFSVRDFILAGRYAYTKNGIYTSEDYKIADDIMLLLNLQQLSEKGVHALSGGEFQKVRLARALVQEPEFLLLDEPVNNIDFVFESKMLNLLKNLSTEKGIGIFLIIHDLNLAVRFADKIVLLPELSNTIFGTVEEVFTEENLRKTFNSELQTYKHPIYNCIQVYEK